MTPWIRILFGLWIALQWGQAFATDKLVIISPHRKAFQSEIIPAFKAHYKSTFNKDVQVDWLDQGGTSQDMRFIEAKYEGGKQSSGMDIFWGGGTAPYVELSKLGLLAKYKLPEEIMKDVPSKVAGVPIHGSSGDWFGSSLSSFGIFYNRAILGIRKMPEPKLWSDLTRPEFNSLVSTTDPRKSGSTAMMFYIILETHGWEQGWQVLHAIAGNTRSFELSSSTPIKKVENGDAVAALSVDFYAQAKIAVLGAERVGFVIPEGQSVFNAEGIAILKGAQNEQVARRFVDYVLSPPAQKILVLAKGVPGGPKLATQGRIAVSQQVYAETRGKRISDFNPFEQKELIKIDESEYAALRKIMNDLYGALIVDQHDKLKQAWSVVIKRGNKPADLAELSKMPIDRDQMTKMAADWENAQKRNEHINAWVAFAGSKYDRIIAGKFSH